MDQFEKVFENLDMQVGVLGPCVSCTGSAGLACSALAEHAYYLLCLLCHSPTCRVEKPCKPIHSQGTNVHLRLPLVRCRQRW